MSHPYETPRPRYARKTAGPLALGLAAALALGAAPEAKAQSVFQCPTASPTGAIGDTLIPPGSNLGNPIPSFTTLGRLTDEHRRILYGGSLNSEGYRRGVGFRQPLPIPTAPIECGFSDDVDRAVVVLNPRITVTEDWVPGIYGWHQGNGNLVIYAHGVDPIYRGGSNPHPARHFHPLDHGRYAARTSGDGDYNTGEDSHGVWAEHTGEGVVGIDFRDMSLSTAGGDFAVGLYASHRGSYVWDPDTSTSRRARGAVVINVIETERDRPSRARPLIGTRGDESDAIRAEYTRAAAYGHVVVTVEGYTIATGGIVPPGPQIPKNGEDGGILFPSLNGYESRGIYAFHEGRGDIRVAVTDSHVLTWGIGAHGIFADHVGKSETITNELAVRTTEVRSGGGAIDIDVTGGEIRTAGGGAIGVYGFYRGSAVAGAGAAGSGGGGPSGVTIDLAGVTVATAGGGSHGVLGWVRRAFEDADGDGDGDDTPRHLDDADGDGDDDPVAGTGQGAVTIDVTGGAVSTGGEGAHAVWGLHDGEGDVSVKFSGRTATAATEGDRSHGIAALHRGTGGDVELTLDGAAVSTAGDRAYGAYARNAGDGALTLSMTGGAVSTRGAQAFGLYGLQESGGALAVSMTGGSVATAGAGAHGVLAVHRGGGAGTVSVTVADGSVTASGTDSFGILVVRQDAAAAAPGPAVADEHDAAIRVTVGEDFTITAGTGVLIDGGARPVVDVKGTIASGDGTAIRLRRHDDAATVIIDGRVEGDIVLDDGDLILEGGKDGVFIGDINLNGGSWTNNRAPGASSMIGTLYNPGSPYTVVAGTRRIVYNLDAYAGGADVTLPEGISLPGVDDESIVNEKGNLVVRLQAAAGETPVEATGRIGGVIRTSGGVPTVWYQESGEKPLRVGLVGTEHTLPIGVWDLGIAHEGEGRYRFGSWYGPRARVYEALPALLLGLNRMPTYRDRMAAPRGAHGSWARVAAEGGRWKALNSTSTTAAGAGSSGAGIAFDYNRYAAQAGLDLPLTDCECDSIGVAVNYRHGTAELPQPGGWALGRPDGRILASGFGFAVSGARRFEGGEFDGVYLDGQVAATWYDVKLESGTRGLLKSGARAFGYAVAVEMGRELPMGGAGLVTPRARVVHSQVGMTAFTDSLGAAVALERGRSLAAQLGVGMEVAPSAPDLEGVRVFGALDVEGELTRATRTRAAGTSLESKAPGVQARLELGLSSEAADGRYAARGAVHATTGGGATGYGGELSLRLRF